jgi:hypothetical protein
MADTMRLPFSEPTTSKDAAERMGRKPKKVAEDRSKILEFLRQCGERGATDSEMQNFIPMLGNTQRPRRGELVTADMVKKHPTLRRDRSSVWVLQDHAKDGEG